MAERSVQTRQKLTVPYVTEQLDQLETAEDAKRWVRQLVLWTAGGKMVSGSHAQACASLVKAWTELHQLGAAHQVIKDLEVMLQEVNADRDRLTRENEQLRLEIGKRQA